MQGKRADEEIQRLIEASIAPDQVEIWMKMIENLRARHGLTYDQALRQVASLHADPSRLPADVFISLEDENDEDADDFLPDEIFSDGEEEYDMESGEYGDGARKGQSFATTSRVERAGACIELWPHKKILQAMPIDSEKFVHEEFPNVIEIASHDHFVKRMKKYQSIFVDNLDLKQIKASIKRLPRHPDAVVMDPPITEANMSEETLSEIFKLFKLPNSELVTFIFVWIDSVNMEKLTRAADRANILFCDSIVVELLNAKMEPFRFVDSLGFTRTSRMVMLYRTMDLSKDKIAQQMAPDCGFGMARMGGKSRGRPGMPQVPHQNAERLLPPQAGTKRVFIEFWPTRMMPRKGWTSVDERQ